MDANVNACTQRPCMREKGICYSRIVASFAVLLSFSLAAQPAHFATWRRDASGFKAQAETGDLPITVGSLQKPFVAKAWAAAHPGQEAPRFHCGADSRCWFRAGHGEVGLVKALVISCNTYFRQLAAETPPQVLASTFLTEGFETGPRSPGQAIGLADGEGLLRIRPSALLEAYTRLVNTPWSQGEPIRQQVLAGLREAALTGTASSLGHRGYWAKTGTVPAPNGDPTKTWGLALAVDDSGRAILGRLEPGTGRGAAAALAGNLSSHFDGMDPSKGTDTPLPPVTVRLFDLLHARHLVVRNLGTAPIPTRRGFLGPGATLELVPGEQVGPGLLEIRAPERQLLRRIQGRLLRTHDRGLLATMSARDYAAGVIAAELPEVRDQRRMELGAAVLRFLKQGPRHGDADVCDNTHCAWFVGRGPRVLWTTPWEALELPGEDPGFSDAEWSAMVETARRPGPSSWTSHCGGRRLSPQEVWGSGDTDASPCPRHNSTQSRPWIRTWKRSDLERAFGGQITILQVEHSEGVWVLRVNQRRFRFDEAHRRLAAVLGWEALPSPADAIEAVAEGFQVRGTGSGHRVGLCLAD